MSITDSGFLNLMNNLASIAKKDMAVIVIDESDNVQGDTKEEQKLFDEISHYQLRILAQAKIWQLPIYEITFGSPSRKAITDMTQNANVTTLRKSEANALKDQKVREFICNDGRSDYFVMGFHTDACVASTIGAISFGENIEERHPWGVTEYGLLQYGKKVYTSLKVLHPPKFSSGKWGDVADYKRLIICDGGRP